MKSIIYSTLISSLVFLVACSGSDIYQGNWKATDSNGEKFEIDFAPKSFTIKDMDGKVETHDYTQNSVKIQNSVKTYGIRLGDGRSFYIFFPNSNDESKGVIMLEHNLPIYTISRTSYILYNDLYKLTE